MFVGEPSELLGKSWTYRIHIGKLQGLGFLAKRAYVQYSIFGEVCDFEDGALQQNFHMPVFNVGVYYGYNRA